MFLWFQYNVLIGVSEMEVNFIEASDKLKSALKRIENRIDEIENHSDGMDSYYIDYMNLVDIGSF